MLKQDAARLLNVNADPVNVKLEEINNIRIIFDRIDRYISFIILSLFTSKLYFVFFQPSLPKKKKNRLNCLEVLPLIVSFFSLLKSTAG